MNGESLAELVLFHYTSLAAMISIAENRVLWASSIHHMNDGTEFQLGFDLLLSEVRQFELNAETKPFAEEVKSALGSYREVNVYVASFSREDDLLSQWRSYCPPSKGVCFGVRASDLKAAAFDQGFTLVECIYDPKRQRDAVRAALMVAIDQYRRSDQQGRDARRLLAFEFIGQFIRVAATLKHPSFGEEREWRLISGVGPWKHPQVSYREGTSTIVPYFKLRLPVADGKLNFHSFVLGPTPHKQLSMSSMLALTHALDVRCEQIRPSRVPFRAW